ncbi:hypothetical protein PSOS111911_17695 [Pseudoalteromonas ostreae]
MVGAIAATFTAPLGLIGCKERSSELTHMSRWIIPLIIFVLLTSVMAMVGMLLGIPTLLENFRH